jgi:hypothetical protein
MNRNVSKAIATTAVRAGLEIGVKGESSMEALKVGAVNGVSVLLVDSVVGLVPLNSMLAFLGTYTEDVISSLISAVLMTLWEKYSQGQSFGIKKFGVEFLYSFGSTVAGGYIAPSVQAITGM